MEVTGHLKLSQLLENFNFLEREFRYNVKEYEIETTDNEYLYADISVRVDYKDSRIDEDFGVVIERKIIEVVLHEEYFGTDEDGGELELKMEEKDMIRIEKEIEEAISNQIN